MGTLRFAHPTRLSASCGAGRSGLRVVGAEEPAAEGQAGVVPGGGPDVGDIVLFVADQVEYHDAVEPRLDPQVFVVLADDAEGTAVIDLPGGREVQHEGQATAPFGAVAVGLDNIAGPHSVHLVPVQVADWESGKRMDEVPERRGVARVWQKFRKVHRLGLRRKRGPGLTSNYRL